MSIKKTWFSYILWLLATGFSVLFIYTYIDGIITCYSFEQFKGAYYLIGFCGALILTASLLYLLIGWIRSRINGVSIPKWGKRLFYILILFGMIVLFAITRYMVLWSTSLENVFPMDIYEAAKVIGTGQSALQESLYVFEEIYINVLSGLFLFLGNKMEIMLYFQIFLQTVSFLLLLFIGKTLQKGFFGWGPAIVYVLSEYCMEKVVCLRADNFWFFIVVLCIAVVCLLERAWKNKTITYILVVLMGIVFAVACALDSYPHMADRNSVFEFWFYEKLIDGGAAGYFSFLVLMVGMVFYCISFWKTKTDNVSAYILPIVGFSVILYFELWPDVPGTLFMLIRIYFAFIVAEGLRILLEQKPKVMTGQNAEPDISVDEQSLDTTDVSESKTEAVNDFEWTEMQAIMEQKEETVAESNENDSASDSSVPVDVLDAGVPEEPGVIRVSDILKAVSTVGDVASVTEQTTEENVVDKTAMIENVLPMPKKHVSRTFEYAFEPAEDMMHYDVEIENDKYDYE